MKKPKFITEFDDIPTPRTKMPELEVDDRVDSFSEVELGLSRELALAEAARCLSCRRCLGCGLCLAECDRDAIVYEQTPETSRLSVDTVVLAPGSGCFDATRKQALGYAASANVVTTPELERILSPTGPYGGLPIRPGDGRFPRRIAFVQCVGSREEGIGANYCSTTCCNQALRLADELLDKIDGSRVTFFHRGMRPLGRTGERLYGGAMERDDVEFVFSQVEGVDAGECTEPVQVRYDVGDGEVTGEFDLVVLSVGQSATRSAKSAARLVRARTNKFGFIETRPLSVTVGENSGAPFAGSCTEPMDAARALAAGQAAASWAAGELSSRDDVNGSAGARGASGHGAPGHGPETEGEGGASGEAAELAPVVWVCEYGLETKGIAADEVVAHAGAAEGVSEVGRGRLACAPEALTRLHEILDRHGPARLLIVGCHPDSHMDFWRARAAGLEGRARDVRLFAGDDAASALQTFVDDRVESGSALKAAADPHRAPAAAPRDRSVLVLGGGSSGFSAAEEASRRGFAVTLLEAGDGPVQRLRGRAMSDQAHHEEFAALIERVMSSPLVELRFGTRVTGIERHETGFDVGIDGPDGRGSVSSGAIVIARENDDYDRVEHMGGNVENVLTQAELAPTLHDEAPEARSIVMIQCVGSRTPEHPHCSRTCCAEAMANALRLKELDSAIDITVLHRDIRVWGFDEEKFADAIDAGVEFVRVEPSLDVTSDARLEVAAVDADTGEELRFTPDLVVLSTGVLAPIGSAAAAAALHLETDGSGFLVPLDEAMAPVETGVPGVYVAGPATGPVPAGEGAVQARAAAGKACLFLGR